MQTLTKAFNKAAGSWLAGLLSTSKSAQTIKVGNRSYLIASDDNYLDAMGDTFEPCMVQLFQALISPNDVVADIGANIGLTAILFSTLVSKVVAFEPSPSTYNILKKNLRRANINNVDAINLGLGKQTESLTITFAKNNRSGGYVSNKIRPTTGHQTEKIQIDTFDNYFSNCATPPSFLKIDVEGFEHNVIEGAQEYLRNNKPTVVMEMNHFCLDVLQRITIPDFLDYMRSVFPYLYAVDSDNSMIADLHKPDEAYMVMHEHVVRHRFPNLVGAFDQAIQAKLERIAKAGGRLSQPLGWLQAEAIPASMAADSRIEIPVTFSNQGQEAWHGYGANPVLLSYHWQAHDGTDIIFDGLRTELPSSVVYPGESAQAKVIVQTPVKKGSFMLTLTLVQEGVCWFEDQGFEVTSRAVEIA